MGVLESGVRKEQRPEVSTTFGQDGGSVGRRGPRGLNLAHKTNNSGENGNKGNMLYIDKIIKKKCSHVRKHDEVQLIMRSRHYEVRISTHMRSMVLNGKHGLGCAWQVPSAFSKQRCDLIGI